MISSQTTTLAKIAPGPELEVAASAGLNTLIPVMSRGQQVGGELDAPHRAVDGPREGLGQHRLADARARPRGAGGPRRAGRSARCSTTSGLPSMTVLTAWAIAPAVRATSATCLSVGSPGSGDGSPGAGADPAGWTSAAGAARADAPGLLVHPRPDRRAPPRSPVLVGRCRSGAPRHLPTVLQVAPRLVSSVGAPVPASSTATYVEPRPAANRAGPLCPPHAWVGDHVHGTMPAAHDNARAARDGSGPTARAGTGPGRTGCRAPAGRTWGHRMTPIRPVGARPPHSAPPALTCAVVATWASCGRYLD